MRFLVCVLLSIIVPLTACSAANAEPDIFETEDNALAFVASLGPDWDHQVENDRTYYDHRLIHSLRQYTTGEDDAWIGIGTDADDILRSFEIRFPDSESGCKIPDIDEFVEELIRRTEPEFLADQRNINRVASMARLVWPNTSNSSGPSQRLGDTTYSFLRMNGYCTVRMFRLNSDDSDWSPVIRPIPDRNR